MEGIKIEQGQSILLLWFGQDPSEVMKDTVNRLLQKVGQSGKVQVEHAERLSLSAHSNSSFDIVISGLLNSSKASHDTNLLGEVCRILKPRGKIIVQEPTTESAGSATGKSKDKLKSLLKLSGFVDISEPVKVEQGDVTDIPGSTELYRLDAAKPDYEVGASSQLKLSFASKAPAPATNAEQVWSLSANDLVDDDLELINDDDLLDDDDLKKPDPSSLRASCADGPKKKKACKNCTCGLADELDAESAKQNSQPKTSACGSCYLGDAFRCASCPYVGMPAFKPGEKIQLSKQQLKADI
ncbi:anamorsin homolog [Littorina saxatilis]|uniref:Anamorsin homolog n=1 Tax=Littorina saxatilis TaxID=31220 RepID=A0AAN9GNC5_9CAEN